MAVFPGLIQKFIATATSIAWWVRNKNLGTLLESVAFVEDQQVQDLYEGLRLGYPLDAEDSALETLAFDRQIQIFDTEPDESKRLRLAQFWNLHRQFGTHQGEMRNLAPYFLPVQPLMRIVHQDGDGTRATWHTLNTDGSYTIDKVEPSNWDYDGATDLWSRWWCILYYEALLPWLEPAEYDDGTQYDDGTLWDGGPSTDQIAAIVGALQGAQGVHSMLWGVIVTQDPDSFDPNSTSTTDPDGWTSLPVGNWGFTIDNGTGLPTRPPFASWIYDKGQG